MDTSHSSEKPKTKLMTIEHYYSTATFVGIVSALGAILCLGLMNMDDSCFMTQIKLKSVIKWSIAVIWSVGPALWFGIENWQIRRHLMTAKNVDPKWLECHKLNQDTAKMAWAGVSILILLLVQES